MPLYDFRCRGCDDRFEALVRPGATPACPACGSGDLERLPSAFAVNTPERSRQVADKQVKRAAEIGRQENAARYREFEQHRKEDH